LTWIIAPISSRGAEQLSDDGLAEDHDQAALLSFVRMPRPVSIANW
jgi:hypothetical protein